MNRGGHTNINGAPVDSLVPVLDHLNTVEAMTKALDNPAFAAKWGDMLRAKHPVLARAHDNAKVSRARDGNFVAKGFENNSPTPTTRTAPNGAIIPAESAALAARIESLGESKEEKANLQERHDELHEAALATNPTTPAEAAIAAALSGAQVKEVVAEVAGAPIDMEVGEVTRAAQGIVDAESEMNSYLGGSDGFRGVNSRAFAEGKTEKPRDIAPLVIDLSQWMVRLDAMLRKGGIRRKPAPASHTPIPCIVGVQGLRGFDSATHRKAVDVARASDRAYLESFAAMDSHFGATHTITHVGRKHPGKDTQVHVRDANYKAEFPMNWYWDDALGIPRPVRV